MELAFSLFIIGRARPDSGAAGFYSAQAATLRTTQNIGSSQANLQKSVGIWQVFKASGAVLAISLGMQLINGPIMSFLSLYLVDVRHMSAAAGSMWVTVVRIGGFAGSLIGGWLTDKWGRRNTIFLTLIIFGPVVYLVTALPFGMALAIVFVIFGCLMSMRETTMQTLLMDNSPPQLRATVFGIYFGFGQQGSSVIQPVAGDFMDLIGIVGVFNSTAFISIGLSVLAVLVAVKQTGIVHKFIR